MSTSLTAVRGTCQSCNGYVTTYAPKYETVRRARTHRSWQGEGLDRDWRKCPGSNQPVRAA